MARKSERRFEDKVFALTGAASGIGRATAHLLAQRGARLALADVNEAGLQETAARCREAGAEVVTTLLDVSDRDAIYAWAAATVDHFDQVHGIINNAGVALGGRIEDVSDEDFEWLMDINFWGVVHGTRAFLPHLKASGEGHVVNISSVFGLIAMPLNGPYNASKFAVRGFTEALAEELAVENAPVEVTCVHPGGIDTNIAAAARFTPTASWGLTSSADTAAEFKKLARTTPDQAAAAIVDAIERKRRRLLIGKDAVLIDVVQRTLPVLYQSLVTRIARRTRFRRDATATPEPVGPAPEGRRARAETPA